MRILLFLLLLSTNLLAKKEAFDLRYEAFARSNPIGAYARAEAGYSIGLWDAQHPKAPLYGFVRPMVQFQTSGLINTVRGFVEFYPISFFGLYVGKAFMRRDLKSLDNFDCDTSITCKSSEMTRNIWGAKLALKFGGFFMLNRLQWHTTSVGNNIRNGFAEEQGTVIGTGSKDKLFQFTQVAGYDFNKKHGAGYLLKRNLLKNGRQDTTMSVLLYKRSWQMDERNITLLTGPGVFHTRQGTNHPMYFAVLQIRELAGWTVF